MFQTHRTQGLCAGRAADPALCDHPEARTKPAHGHHVGKRWAQRLGKLRSVPHDVVFGSTGALRKLSGRAGAFPYQLAWVLTIA
jgi:hypothetical protein